MCNVFIVTFTRTGDLASNAIQVSQSFKPNLNLSSSSILGSGLKMNLFWQNPTKIYMLTYSFAVITRSAGRLKLLKHLILNTIYGTYLARLLHMQLE